MQQFVDVRMGAIALISPLIVAYIHQVGLGCKAAHPMSLNELAEQACEMFVRAYAVNAVPINLLKTKVFEPIDR